jgi:Staphylococcal nuclease homologue/Metal binding domain of Ada
MPYAVHTTDRYSGLVGEVFLPDGRSFNQAFVKAGMAWWYKPHAAKDTTLAQLEAEARAPQRELWAEAHPIPPWAWRKETHGASAASSGAASGEVLGTRNTRVYHLPGCPGYERMKPTNRVLFATEAEAQQAGYRRAGHCP